MNKSKTNQKKSKNHDQCRNSSKKLNTILQNKNKFDSRAAIQLDKIRHKCSSIQIQLCEKKLRKKILKSNSYIIETLIYSYLFLFFLIIYLY
jgi:hypothetical protein